MWGDLSVSAIRDPNGKHIATLGVLADITERKRTEEALRESERRFREFVEMFLWLKSIFESINGT